jgi:predicted oxidoreductase
MSDFLQLPTGIRTLGASGIEVAPLAWGMWRFRGNDRAHADRLVRAALDCGFSLLDTADVFGAAETLLGQVLAAAPALRRRFVLSSKGGIIPGTPYNSSAKYLVSACEASLRRLNTDTIDLYQIHRPDILAHPQEVAHALEKLRASGKIRAAGVSNHTVSQTSALQSFLPFPLVSHQIELSVIRIEPLVDGLLDQAIERRMAVLAWSPLGGGLVSGVGTDTRSRVVVAALDKIAAREGVPRTAVALAWILAHPSRPIPIIGSQRPEHMADAAKALDIRLTREDWYVILTASRQARLP